MEMKLASKYSKKRTDNTAHMTCTSIESSFFLASRFGRSVVELGYPLRSSTRPSRGGGAFRRRKQVDFHFLHQCWVEHLGKVRVELATLCH